MSLDLLDSFNEAFNRHDVDSMMSMMTPDCLFENTYPAPDGTSYLGQADVRAFWEEFFRSSPLAHLEVVDIFVSGDRAAQRWVYSWASGDGGDGARGHVRGVDIFRFQDGLIAEKLSYVKG